jgi:hypothetical protein
VLGPQTVMVVGCTGGSAVVGRSGKITNGRKPQCGAKLPDGAKPPRWVGDPTAMARLLWGLPNGGEEWEGGCCCAWEPATGTWGFLRMEHNARGGAQ